MNERTWQILSAVLIAFILAVFTWIGVSADDYIDKRIATHLEAPDEARGELKEALLVLEGKVDSILVKADNNTDSIAELREDNRENFKRVINLLERRNG